MNRTMKTSAFSAAVTASALAALCAVAQADVVSAEAFLAKRVRDGRESSPVHE